MSDDPGLGRGSVTALLALFGFGYLATVCPDIYFRDAGELSASAASLGVAHPTGFPLYMLLAKLATFLPFGSIGFRINLLSVGCGVATVWLLGRAAYRITEDRAASTAMALAFGATGTFWLHSTTAEVYVPNLLGLVWLLERLVAGLEGSQRAFRTAAVLTGLGAGLHAASFAVIGASMWIATFGFLAARRGVKDVGRLIGYTVPLTALGTLVLAYLPIRAATDPYRNWGDPSSLGGLWDHLTGARIRSSFSAQMGGDGALDIWLERATLQLIEQLSWLTGFAVVGLMVFLLRRRPEAWILMCGATADVAFSTLLNPMGMDDLQTGVFTTASAAILCASGLSAFRRGVLDRGMRYGSGFAVGLLGVGLAVPAIISGWNARDLRHLYHAAQLGHEGLDQAPPRALLLVTSDDMASALTFLQGIENRRPDVTVVVKQHLSEPVSLAQAKDRSGTEHVSGALVDAAIAGAHPTAQLRQILAENKDRYPVLYEPGDSVLDGQLGDELRLDLPLARLYGDPTRNLMSKTYFYRMRWRAISGSRWPEITIASLSRRYSGLGIWLWGQGDKRFGLSLVREACALAPTEPVVRNNCGSLELELDNLEIAARQFEVATTLRPTYALGWFNLGVTQYHQGRRLEAAESFALAARLGGGTGRTGRSLLYLGVLAANAGRLGEAYALLSSGLPSLSGPEHAQAKRMLAQLDGMLSAGATAPATQSK